MTNHSFRFTCRGAHYLLRIPGEGTKQLIDRYKEAEVYRVIAGKKLCDDPFYLDPATGYKITRYLEGVRTADPTNADALQKCIAKLHLLHEMQLTVGHRFDIFGQILSYEQLRKDVPSQYTNYEQVKARVFFLQDWINTYKEPYCLTHIDAVSDNFLFAKDQDGNEELQLTDWEYAGMQDPHVDLAMFCIYSGFSQEQIDRFTDLYFNGGCPAHTRIKIYCYVAACGLLWSNWCEFKRLFGIEFGSYAQMQYRYAEDYSRLAREMIGFAHG